MLGPYVNQELVKEGWRWWYQKYAPVYTELEKQRGLWVYPSPVYHESIARRETDKDMISPILYRLTLKTVVHLMAHQGLALSTQT